MNAFAPLTGTMKVALLGNPNAGKSTLFNRLTGLKQKVGNFPGVTVEKKVGKCKLKTGEELEIIDLPGTYSLYPKSLDEEVVVQTLLDPQSPDQPDLILLIADASNLKRHLLLFSQIKDLGYPVILVLNLIDQAEAQGLSIDIEQVRAKFRVDAITLNAKSGKNLEELKVLIQSKLKKTRNTENGHYMVNPTFFQPQLIQAIKEEMHLPNDYLAYQYAHHYQKLPSINQEAKQHIARLVQRYGFDPVHLQSKETIARYEIIQDVLDEALHSAQAQESDSLTWSERLDQILVHQVWGYVCFFALLMLIFQAVYSWATYPMDGIEWAFGSLQELCKQYLPAGVLTDLLADGVIAGLGGIMVFIPQIAILFAFIAILEESGYMARVMFIMDKLMRKFGLNGKSVVPLISGVACAVPAIMATRNIDNWKERLITIFVTPLMSCSARLPVYIILIALIVPDQTILGVFNLQGFALMGMYLLGFVMALLSAWVMQKILKSAERSFLIMELPTYKFPNWSNIFFTILEKVKVFVLEAGKIILAMSIILWVLSSYGPPQAMEAAEKKAKALHQANPSLSLENKVASLRLEASYAGQFGKLIEPIIVPLGYDWKIGIALITSFAAREVFVSTISTIYSVGSGDENLNTIRKKMQAEINPKTGKPVFTPAVGCSLLIFYAFAMQCMSTLAIVYRETKSWKWPLLQFTYLTALAYISSFAVYQLMS